MSIGVRDVGELTRLVDWHARLVAYLSDASRQPFEYGRHDCATFAAGAVAAMTGTDLAEAMRGRYRTLKGGLRMLRRDGFADHVEFAAANFEEVPVARACPGDIAAVPGPDGQALGIVQGGAIYVLTPGGLGLVPLLGADRVFRV